MLFMLLSGIKPGIGEFIQVYGVLLLSFLGQFRIDLHDHGSVRMTHPGLQCFKLHTGFIADRAERDAEIVAADPDVFPGREWLAFLQELFMGLRFPVPTLMASVYFVFQEGNIC